METSRFTRRHILLLGVAAVMLAIGTWWVIGRPAPPRDVPAVPETVAAHSTGIVDSRTCAECHAEEFRDYQTSGHAMTLWSTRDFPFRERFDDLTFTDSERNETYQYFLNEAGLDVVVPGRFGGDRFPLHFAFGSGQHAITFVSLTPDGSGLPNGIEHRVSWFTGMDRADLTPGQLGRTVDHPIECFGRVIQGNTLERCFECHTTKGTIEGDTVKDLIPNVGCASCHDNSAAHVAEMQNGGDSSDHGFERHPWRTADQIQICADCHRGEADVEKTDIVRTNSKIVRFQPVGLLQSQCYIQSGKSLSCTSCHDPHQHASRQTPLQYEQKCLNCHTAAPESVACSVSPDSDCIGCHMPRVEVHPSISFHDHWIRIRDETDPPSVEDKVHATE